MSLFFLELSGCSFSTSHSNLLSASGQYWPPSRPILTFFIFNLLFWFVFALGPHSAIFRDHVVPGMKLRPSICKICILTTVLLLGSNTCLWTYFLMCSSLGSGFFCPQCSFPMVPFLLKKLCVVTTPTIVQGNIWCWGSNLRLQCWNK